MFLWMALLIIGVLTLMLLRARVWGWLLAEVVWIWIGVMTLQISLSGTLLWFLLMCGPTVVVAIAPLRQTLLTQAALALCRKILPRLSETERDAIEAGTVWWDADLFSGKPQWQRLLALPPPTLTAQEQAFLDHDVEQLCAMLDDWDSSVTWQDLPPQAWQFIKERGFLGMIIPRQYGGRQFSAYMHSQVIMKLSSRCPAAAMSVMMPNAQGAAALLLHYGSEAQKDYYLPRLARGEDIPCFALTSPYAGSDAAAIPDIGVVCRDNYKGCEVLGLRLTWCKRTITLAPVATLLGLAFRVQDPDHLLGGKLDLGITCALIPSSHPGVVCGRRHWPLDAVLQNGPTSGDNVFIPLDWIIGGREQIGRGWRMLTECLAAGRAISLPSSSVGFSKAAVRGTSAYAAIRHQSDIAIGKFEGVQEALARMGGHLYMMDATRRLSALAVDAGERSSVIAAIAKYHVTERSRMVVTDGMDVIGGKGICLGPGNFLARIYQQVPIAITVEGANILTRNLIIFGQGAIRCHPYLQKEMAALAEPDQARALVDFDRAFFGHLRFFAANLARSLVLGWSGGRLAHVPSGVAAESRQYYRSVARLSAIFALLSEVSMLVPGGSLRFRERISARLGDVLSQLYMISATLKRYEDDGRMQADLPYLAWSVQDALFRAEDAIRDVLTNFPSRPLAIVLRIWIWPLGAWCRKPSDGLASEVALSMQTPGAARDRLLADIYLPEADSDQLGCGERAFALVPQVQAIEMRLGKAIRDGVLPPMPQSLVEMRRWNRHVMEQGLISVGERVALDDFAYYGDIFVQVDDFAADLDRSAFSQTALAALVQQRG